MCLALPVPLFRSLSECACWGWGCVQPQAVFSKKTKKQPTAPDNPEGEGKLKPLHQPTSNVEVDMLASQECITGLGGSILRLETALEDYCLCVGSGALDIHGTAPSLFWQVKIHGQPNDLWLGRCNSHGSSGSVPPSSLPWLPPSVSAYLSLARSNQLTLSASQGS